MMSTSKVLPRLQILGTAWSRAFRNVWMLEELGIPYEILNVLPASSIVKSYVPSGKIPVLLEYNDDANAMSAPSFVLYESSAINTYLGDQYGGIVNKDSGSLMPPFGTRERAVYDQTISCLTNEIDSQGISVHRKHDAMKSVYGDSPAAVTAAHRNFDVINQQLATQLQPYLLGPTFTAADILYVHCLDWSKGIGWHSNWPASLKTYRGLCHQRNGYQKAKFLRDQDKKEREEQMQTYMMGAKLNSDNSK
jgi:glutathione S-transferase